MQALKALLLGRSSVHPNAKAEQTAKQADFAEQELLSTCDDIQESAPEVQKQIRDTAIEFDNGRKSGQGLGQGETHA